ncbi:unnamed protein product [Lathyrus oleraceus]|uniref:Uncharacterized protein n=1 Tax=Pisum sativum TaxID=3888 RepID=A0A9D4XCK6_PEA|nr:uncharacterized protein LOC127135374 [Pisum sativum]KAI5418678.1 hypothetical protein KIW84_043054 [Pisum sativum]
MEETMERLSSPPKNEEKTMCFYVFHPCSCLKEALVTFFKCLGFESTQIKEEENSSTSLLKHHACSSDSIVDSEDLYNSSSSNRKHSQEGVADSPTTSTQTLNLSSMGRGGPRRTPLTKDPSPGHN